MCKLYIYIYILRPKIPIPFFKTITVIDFMCLNPYRRMHHKLPTAIEGILFNYMIKCLFILNKILIEHKVYIQHMLFVTYVFFNKTVGFLNQVA